MTQVISCLNPQVTKSDENIRKEGIRPNVNIYKSEEGYTFSIELPGVTIGNINIEIDEENVLSLEAKNSFEHLGNARLKQFETLDYQRSFRLGKEIDKEKVTTELSQGILTLFVPIREESKPKKITISV